LELLLADESNPRSVGFQLGALLHQIHRHQENEEGAENSIERHLALKALNSVRDAQKNFIELEVIVGELKMTLWELSDALTARYFSNLTAARFTASS
jgi:uncharacterized alpha-E superfamily protein